MRIIPKLYFQDTDENGQDFLRPATTEDVDNVIAEWALAELKNADLVSREKK